MSCETPDSPAADGRERHRRRLIAAALPGAPDARAITIALAVLIGGGALLPPVWMLPGTPAAAAFGVAGLLTLAAGILLLARWLVGGLRRAETNTRAAFARSPVPMALMDPDSAQLVEVNDAACALLGRARTELLRTSLLHLSPAGDRAHTRAVIAGSGGPAERPYTRPDGSVVWALTAVTVMTGEDGTRVAFCVMQDLTARKRAEQTLQTYAREAERRALHDPLTGLPNRALLADRIGHALQRRAHQTGQVALVCLDLDRFKHLINDTAGRRAGDELLRALAARLQAAAGPADTVARLGGDEFAVLCEDLPGDGATDAMLLARRVLDALTEPVWADGRMYELTASAGIALAGAHAADAEELLRNAETAMYHAKSNGPGRGELFDSMLARDAGVEAELRAAIDTGQLRLHYQPIVAADTGRMVCVESLVRWQHPTRGLLSPAAFMDVAEDSGLVVPLGRWVLREACRQAAAWQADRDAGTPLGVTVNVSGRHVAAGTLIEDLAAAAAGLELAPGSITIEVTEHALMDHAGAFEVLSALRDQRFRVAMDDFGSGLSSLARLRELPLDTIKFDRAFVASLCTDPRASAIIEAVLRMADALGLEVIAEGVEEQRQLDELRRIGCPRVQGYLTGRPAPASEISRRLALPDSAGAHQTPASAAVNAA